MTSKTPLEIEIEVLKDCIRFDKKSLERNQKKLEALQAIQKNMNERKGEE